MEKKLTKQLASLLCGYFLTVIVFLPPQKCNKEALPTFRQDDIWGGNSGLLVMLHTQKGKPASFVNIKQAIFSWLNCDIFYNPIEACQCKFYNMDIQFHLNFVNKYFHILSRYYYQCFTVNIVNMFKRSLCQTCSSFVRQFGRNCITH